MNYGYLVAFTGLAVLAVTYGYDLVRSARLRKIVWASLDNAWSGGCFNSAEAGYLHEMSATEIAEDMTLYCDDASGYSRDEMLPYVTAWMQKNGLTP